MNDGTHMVFVKYEGYIFFRFGTGGINGKGEYQGSEPTLGMNPDAIISRLWERYKTLYPALATYEVLDDWNNRS